MQTKKSAHYILNRKDTVTEGLIYAEHFTSLISFNPHGDLIRVKINFRFYNLKKKKTHSY